MKHSQTWNEAQNKKINGLEYNDLTTVGMLIIIILIIASAFQPMM